MAKVASSLEAMDRMIFNLKNTIIAQNEVASRLKNDYNSVGSEWDDEKYEELGRTIDEAIVALKSAEPYLLDTITRMQLLKSMLNDYLNQRIS